MASSLKTKISLLSLRKLAWQLKKAGKWRGKCVINYTNNRGHGGQVYSFTDAGRQVYFEKVKPEKGFLLTHKTQYANILQLISNTFLASAEYPLSRPLAGYLPDLK